LLRERGFSGTAAFAAFRALIVHKRALCFFGIGQFGIDQRAPGDRRERCRFLRCRRKLLCLCSCPGHSAWRISADHFSPVERNGYKNHGERDHAREDERTCRDERASMPIQELYLLTQ
jgi:hypothetical protein